MTDVNGLTTSRSKTIAVEAPVAPTAAMTVSCTYLVCNYADTSTAGSGAISTWAWTFGDGSASSGAGGGAHVFVTGGTYTLALRSPTWTVCSSGAHDGAVAPRTSRRRGIRRVL